MAVLVFSDFNYCRLHVAFDGLEDMEYKHKT